MNTAPYMFMLTPKGITRSARLVEFAQYARRAQLLTVLREGAELLVLGAGDAPCIDLRDGGLIWGHLFARDSTARIMAQTASTPLMETAEDFVRQYWGGYLALRHTPAGLDQLRDPSGEIAGYVAAVEETD